MPHTLPAADSPVSPIQLQPLPPTPRSTSRTPNQTQAQVQAQAQAQAQTQSTHSSTSTQRTTWVPFTLRWYFLFLPTTISLSLGSILLYLTLHSKRHHGIGTDDGSSAMLFGWRFLPTLCAVLFTQMTVILFEDVKRTEPFARLARAPTGGANAYGTILQTPRAWWSIFIDICFNRKKIGRTSWALICAALVNVIALLAISPLSSALLTSEEVFIPKVVNFARLIPIKGSKIPMEATSEVYYRTLNAVLRNTSTSAWVTNTSVALPFWPVTEAAQFGPKLSSSYMAWNSETTIFESQLECHELKLESTSISPRQYSDVYTNMLRGPLNGTQPMITFALASATGCKYELSLHPAVDLAYRGGVFWGDASSFFPQSDSLYMGNRIYNQNITATNLWARLNATEQCNGRDIILMSTPWTTPLNFTGRYIPENYTYTRSPDFRMRGLLCESRYLMSRQNMVPSMVGNHARALNTSSSAHEPLHQIPDDLMDKAVFQKHGMRDNWGTYFDRTSMLAAIVLADKTEEINGDSYRIYPGFTGMAPLLAANSNYNLSAMIDDPDVDQRAAAIKGRFFSETIREAFNDPRLVEAEVITGEATTVENRVIVLAEIGFTLAALFFTTSLLLILIFWTSCLAQRPLNLPSDPASTIGLSLLLNRSNAGLSTLRDMHQASRVDLYTVLQKERYLTANGVLLQGDNDTNPPVKVKAKRTWTPRVLHVRMLSAMGTMLIVVLVAVLVLNAFSGRSQLSQLAFIYEADVSKLRLSFSSFAPISIAPTFISIIIALAWDQLDSTFRMLQPYVSMSQGPTPICSGAGLTYRSKSWVGAAIKAARNRHWVLLMISIGSVLAQVLTVSMSALFERESRNVSRQLPLFQSLEIRQVPIITEVEPDKSSSGNAALQSLDNLYLDASKNWLYGASIQQSYNGSQLPWTSEGWSFLPIDLSAITTASNKPSSSSSVTGDGATAAFAVNVTVSVPAIRARLNCEAIEELRNISSWISSVNLTNEGNEYRPSDFAQINETGRTKAFSLLSDLFKETESHTTLLLKGKEASCCSNGTLADPQRAILGYWAPVLPARQLPGRHELPYQNLSWPLSLTTKWIVGKSFNLTANGFTTATSMFYEEVPQIQAARCEPVIEIADSIVVVNKDTGDVISHTIQEGAVSADAAWTDVFTLHASRNKTTNSETSPETVNITASFGVMFINSLLGSSDRSTSDWEATDENAFVFRDEKNGESMDLMTYSMWTLANKDPNALLNFTTLATYADLTFQTFFQHFVNSGLSLSKGGLAYQPINDNSMDSIGRSVDENGTSIEEKKFPVLNTNRPITASVSHRQRVLNMNPVATYLSTAILIWLILTTLVVVCVQRSYTRFMNRDVELIADMLVLIAGSDNLLELAAEKGVELKKNKDIKTMLGWFVDRDGQVRWGVEVVGGRRAVSWVDAPKHGFHIPSSRDTWRRCRTWMRSLS